MSPARCQLRHLATDLSASALADGASTGCRISAAALGRAAWLTRPADGSRNDKARTWRASEVVVQFLDAPFPTERIQPQNNSEFKTHRHRCTHRRRDDDPSNPALRLDDRGLAMVSMA